MVDISDSSTNIFAERKYMVSFASSEVFKVEAQAPEGVFSALKIEDAHTSVIQSCIVRILKKKLVLDYAGVRKEVEAMLKDRFTLVDKEFNSSLEKLMEKGFIS